MPLQKIAWTKLAKIFLLPLTLKYLTRLTRIKTFKLWQNKTIETGFLDSRLIQYHHIQSYTDYITTNIPSNCITIQFKSIYQDNKSKILLPPHPTDAIKKILIYITATFHHTSTFHHLQIIRNGSPWFHSLRQNRIATS